MAMNALLAGLQLDQANLTTRHEWIGGSDANTIMGGNPDRLIKLWREKRGEGQPDDLSDVLAVQMGSFTEPLNRAWFEKHTGHLVSGWGSMATSTEHGVPMRCTLDGIVGEPGEGIFEAKHVGVRNTDAEIFARYVPQLTHNLICTKETLAYLSVFKGNGDWMMLEYELDAAYAARLIEAERQFWHCVQSGEPPAPLPAEPTPKPKGVVEYDMTASNEWPVHAAEYFETELAADRHEIARKALKALVPDDASKCFGHGITISRDKRGALRFSKGE
jgi:predicted phage-related endonuclease